MGVDGRFPARRRLRPRAGRSDGRSSSRPSAFCRQAFPAYFRM